LIRRTASFKFELQPILQSVVDTAARLCRAEAAVIFRLQDGVYRFAAGYSLDPSYVEIERETLISPSQGTVIGRAALHRCVVRIDDARTDPLYEKKGDAKIGGVRSMIGVPLLREGEPIGVIGLARSQVEPFIDREIELVTTFADQAVIAIENVRLFEAEQRGGLLCIPDAAVVFFRTSKAVTPRYRRGIRSTGIQQCLSNLSHDQ
jgi:GAF domain-containing protein